ncbi:MAG: RNA polymerase sigma factor [Clostridia bacterium]|nr:RNA polymerase sigma factor [Clostridia bacterium]
MTDEALVELFWQRDEQALALTEQRHGASCRALARSILHSEDDADECLNDALLRAWRAIPPERPRSLAAWLHKVVRNLAFDRFRAAHAERRGGGELPLLLDELRDVASPADSVEAAVSAKELARSIDRFLDRLSPRERRLFLGRYFYLTPLADLAGREGMRPNHVSVTLGRLRGRLKAHLQKEGFSL